MNTLSYKTTNANAQTVDAKWHVIDGDGLVVGRLASNIAAILRGKHKPSYTPHVDCGDHVIVVNAEKVRFTGQKLDKKEYVRHTGYPGGQRRTTPREVLAKHPERIIEKAVKGMLPKTKLGRQMYKKLHVVVGPDHKHQAQQPQELRFDK